MGRFGATGNIKLVEPDVMCTTTCNTAWQACHASYSGQPWLLLSMAQVEDVMRFTVHQHRAVALSHSKTAAVQDRGSACTRRFDAQELKLFIYMATDALKPPPPSLSAYP